MKYVYAIIEEYYLEAQLLSFRVIETRETLEDALKSIIHANIGTEVRISENRDFSIYEIERKVNGGYKIITSVQKVRHIND